MKIKGEFILRKVASKTIAVSVKNSDKESRVIVELNGTGKEIWRYLEQGCGKEQIVEKMSEKYGVDTETVRNDVQSVLRNLEEAGLLTEPII